MPRLFACSTAYDVLDTSPHANDKTNIDLNNTILLFISLLRSVATHVPLQVEVFGISSLSQSIRCLTLRALQLQPCIFLLKIKPQGNICVFCSKIYNFPLNSSLIFNLNFLHHHCIVIDSSILML